MNRKTEKRVPIRQHVLTIVLQAVLLALLASFITGIFCIRWIRHSSETVLMEQFERNVKTIIEQKALSADARLEHYEKYIEFVTDYISGMYADEENMIAHGKMYYAPVDTKEYALTRGFARKDMNADDFREELLFFSNLEQVLAPIAKSNENLITTVYAGTTSGLLTSYDRWSYLSVPPQGEELIYDYFQSGWYTQGIKENGVFYTGLYADSQGRGLTITVASPFRNTKGEIMGVNCADFDITGLYNELLSIDLGEGTFSFALDKEGSLISPDAENKSLEEYTGLSKEELDELTANPDGIMEKRGAVYVCVPIERVGWTLCVSVPMNAIAPTLEESEQSIFYAFITFAVVVLLIVMVSIFSVNKVADNITHPMELLSRDMKIISDGDLSYRATVYRNDEIGDITSQMNEMVDRLNFTMKELMSSQQYANAMTELATKDSLTGVHNTLAFKKRLELLDQKLADGDKNFGMVMIDLNNLKRINDSYGHDKGDIYIRKVSEIICDTFVHSPVYRVGGDEFVVVLKGRDYRNITELVAQFKSTIHECSANNSLNPWNRVSAAIGYALYDEKMDDTAKSVLTRADREMYQNKGEMKRA